MFDLQRFATLTAGTATELTKAINDANDGDTIELTADITATSYFEINKDLTVDLKGFTLERNASWLFWVNGGNLTLDDTSNAKTGTVQAVSQAVGGSGSFTLNGGTVKGNSGMVVQFDSGSITINGGTIESTAGSDQTVYRGINTAKFNMNGGKIKAPLTVNPVLLWGADTKEILSISGGVIEGNLAGDITSGDSYLGKLKSFVTADTNCALYDSNAFYVGEDYTTLQNSDSLYGPITISDVENFFSTQDAATNAAVNAGCVAAIGNRYYTTLQAAIAAATSGDTIKLIKEATIDYVNGGITIDKDITLDLNEQTLKDGGNMLNVLNGYTLTVNNGTIKAENRTNHLRAIVRLQAGANLNMENVTVNDEYTTDELGCIIDLVADKEATYTGDTGTYAKNLVAKNRGKINLTNVTATTARNAFIYSRESIGSNNDDFEHSGQYVSGYEINVMGGKYTSTSTTHNDPLFLLSGMKATFDGVEIDSKTQGGVNLANRYDLTTIADGTATALANPESTPNATFENCNFSITGSSSSASYLSSLIAVSQANVARIKSGTYTMGAASESGNNDNVHENAETEGDSTTAEPNGLYVFSSNGGFIIDGGNFVNNTSGNSMITQAQNDSENYSYFNSGKPATTITNGTFTTTNSNNTKGVFNNAENAADAEVTGGKYTKAKSDGGTEADTSVNTYVDKTLKVNETTGEIVNGGDGWTAREGSTGVYDYLVLKLADDGTTTEKATLLTASSVADGTTSSIDVAATRYLGISPTTATITWGSGIPDTQKALYNVATYDTASGAITIAPQTEGFTVADSSFVSLAGTGIASLTASGSVGINVDGSGTGLALTNITGGDGNDTLKAGDRATTLDGGAGDDKLVGNDKADTFIYSGGNDTIQDFGDGDKFTLATGFSPITDGTKLENINTGFVLTFDKNNSLTFTGANTSASLQSGDDTYVYTKDSITKGTSVTLSASHGSAFTTPEGIATVNASVVTGNLEINDNSGNNYIIAGKGKNTFNISGGNDSIEGYDSLDAVIVASSLTPATSFDKVSYNGSDYIVSLGSGTTDSLTFKSTNTFALTNGANVYSYTPTEISKNDTSITLGPDHANRFNGTLDAYSTYETIDAAAVTKAIRIIGNDKANLITGGTGGGVILGGNENDTLIAGGGSTTLNGGDGADSLVGSASGADTFIYTGGADSINNYGDGDLVSVASAFKPADATFSVGADNNISLTFDDNNKLIFEGVGDTAVSLKSGRTTFAYTKNYIATNNGITLAAGYNTDFDGTATGNTDYETIDGSAVSKTGGILITGNDKGNYIVGSTVQGSSLDGGKGNDTLVGNATAADVFRYTAGKDVIIGFNGAADSLSIDETAIAKARASSRRLTFTMTDKNNTLVFRSDDSIPAQISLTSGGYLTKDGVVKDESLKLFSSAKGRIDYGVTSINASAVDKQSVTLVGGAGGGSFTFAGINKKRDGFEYGGGAVSIRGYESGRDRINLGDYSISGFTVDDSSSLVAVSLGNSSGAEGAISLIGAKGSEVMIHQNSVNRGNSYSKMVFDETGVVYDKAASKATNATIWGGMTENSTYDAGDAAKLKKIKVRDDVTKIGIKAGGNNTLIDASLAGAGVSLYSGDKNDKFIGSSEADMFVYTKGKDIIQGFGDGDQISLSSSSGGPNLALTDAKITSGKKSIKFKFEGGSKNTLTIKPTKNATLSGALNINGEERIYGKNFIASGTNVSLTSKFGGTYNLDKVNKNASGSYNYVDGHLVEKKLTFKGTDAAESLIGGQNKTTFKGGGGADSLVGGKGADTFFYAKGDKDTVTIANFDFDKDKLKIAGGTLAKVSTIEGGVQFAMKEGRGESPEVGWFNLTSFKKDNADATASNVLIKTNNTYYWFADGNETLASSTDESLQTAKMGDLITSVSKISKSQTTGYQVIELNYSTNLIKSEVAVQVKDTLKAQS